VNVWKVFEYWPEPWLYSFGIGCWKHALQITMPPIVREERNCGQFCRDAIELATCSPCCMCEATSPTS
jgi:hypothetical protein